MRAGKPRPPEPRPSPKPVSQVVVSRYGAPPIVLPHYLPAAAVRQKIGALAARRVNQPRDVFDLDFLLSRYSDSAPRKGEVPAHEASLAANRAAELDFPTFRDAVLPHIDADFRPFYATAAAWSQIQDRVVSYLFGLAS